ncbi:hypothetical protein GCM10028791_29100 [Echinicola sediminis]
MKSLRKMMLTLLLVAGYSFMACAQESEENKAIKKVIQEVFEGMHDRNVLKIGNAFSREPVLQTIRETSEGSIVETSSLQEFLNGIAAVPAEMEIEERGLDYDIRVDGAMAAVWVPYEFYINGKISHRGVNSFQLVKFSDGWKIVYIIDTRRKGLG